MGNGVSTDQGNFPTHGIRDERKAADRKQHDWSPLAEAPITKQPNLLIATANSYIGASNVGPSSSEDNTCQNRKLSVMKDDRSSSVMKDDTYRKSSVMKDDRSSSEQPSSEEERRSSRRREKTRGNMQVETDTGQTVYMQVEPETGQTAYTSRRKKTGSVMQVETDTGQTAYIQVEPDTGQTAYTTSSMVAHREDSVRPAGPAVDSA